MCHAVFICCTLSQLNTTCIFAVLLFYYCHLFLLRNPLLHFNCLPNTRVKLSSWWSSGHPPKWLESANGIRASVSPLKVRFIGLENIKTASHQTAISNYYCSSPWSQVSVHQYEPVICVAHRQRCWIINTESLSSVITGPWCLENYRF